MNLAGKRILITGAGGGIGSALVHHLVRAGAFVLLTGRDDNALRRVTALLDVSEARAAYICADLTRHSERARLCAKATSWEGGIDILINNAGVGDFGLLADRATADIERAVATNLTAPIDLCRELLPHLQRRQQAHIVNIGSAYGGIGCAGSSIYCATKFGLRGFSEALRRELADTPVHVHYFAPRATSTTLNSKPVEDLNAALGNTVDDADQVAGQIVALLRRDRAESVLGWPEKLFTRINALLPRMVDLAMRKQLPVIQHHARLEARQLERYRRTG
jgi:short-subunit dehydrogenase